MTKTRFDRKIAARRKATITPPRPMKLWQDHSNHQEARVEIIPLIDVIFCILTFFILAAIGFSRQQAITLNLPQAKTGAPQMREMLVVSLDDIGQVYVEKQLVTEDQLQQAIENYRQYNPSGLMVLNASRNANYEEVVKILDTLRKVGGDRVALATLPTGSQQTSQQNPSLPNLPLDGKGVDNNSQFTPVNPPNLPELPNLPTTPNSGN